MPLPASDGSLPQGLTPSVRVGLLIDGGPVPAWVARMLELVAGEPGIEIVVVVESSPLPPTGRGFWPRIRALRGTLLYLVWRKLDRRLFAPHPDAFAPTSVDDLLRSVPHIVVTPERTTWSDRITAADLASIAEYRVDVFLRLGFRILRGEILQAARCGVWSFHHGDNAVNRGGPAGVWEVLRGQPTTGSVLQILSEDLDAGTVLQRSWSATDPVSIARNTNNLYWKSLAFVPRKLRELRRDGCDAFLARHAAMNVIPTFYSDPLYVAPTNWRFAWHLPRLVGRIIARRVTNLRQGGRWLLFYHWDKSGELGRSVFRFKALRPPRDRFWADPCAVEHQDESVLFVEEYEYTKQRGHIAAIRFDANGRPLLPPAAVLERPYHLSYPFVFRDGDSWYMIPETMANRTIELYRCVEFPDRWEFVMNLMENVTAVDATIWHHNGRYWLFANMVEHEGASSYDELFLFSSTTLETREWQPHPANPIVSDVRCARPAGAIFQHQGAWYRPAQDCSAAYGRAIRIQRIDTITEHEYRESPAGGITPDWDPAIGCTHTLSHAGKLTCIDGLQTR